MRVTRDRIIYHTASTEEPSCMQCVHVCDDFPCEKECGAEHWWSGYRREEKLSDEND